MRRIDPERFHRRSAEMSAIGGTPAGGVHRLAASAADGASRDCLRRWFDELGMRTVIDPAGNMAGVLDLAGPGAPLVMAGSHLDSQPQGGRFDGALGVVAAVEAAATLRQAAASGALVPRCNLAVTNWTSEEGARFQPSLLGSAAFTGSIPTAEALARTDRDGTTLGAALAATGYAGRDILPSPAAYLELHIECGPVLDDLGEHFGLFTQYWGTVKHRVAFLGEQAHTGPTPMADRKDALLAAAHLITGLRAMAEEAPGLLHTSTGRIDVSPNSPNTVPAEAVLFVELRALEPETLAWAEAALRRHAETAAAKAAVALAWRGVERRPAGRFDAGLIALCTEEAGSLGITARPLATVPGHDAINLAQICPAAMLVVPSVRGISHHPDEYTAPADTLLGAEILACVLWRLCAGGTACFPAAPMVG